MQRPEHPTILSALATTERLAKHGEILAVAGLAYLLGEGALEHRVLEVFRSATGASFPETLTWEAELVREDKGRPDLIGIDGDGSWRVVVEAKIAARLSEGQLKSYANNLATGLAKGAAGLVLLVPAARRSEAEAILGPMGIPRAAVVTWDDLLAPLSGSDTAFRDVAQLRSMCDSLGALDIAPFESTELEYLATRLGDLITVCDRASQALTPPGALLRSVPREGGWYRYFCDAEMGKTCASLGVSPTAKFGIDRLIWLRWQRYTEDIDRVRQRLKADIERVEAVGGVSRFSDGAIWIGLEPEPGVGGTAVVVDLVDRCRQLCEIAGMKIVTRLKVAGG